MQDVYYAAVNGDVDMVNLLIDKANPNARNGFGESPLLMAVWKKHIKVTEILLKHGADPN